MPSSKDFVKSGDTWGPPRAELHNAWTRTAIDYKPPVDRTASDGPPDQRLDIFVRSAAGVSAGAVVGFGDPQRLAVDGGSAATNVVFEQASPAEGRWAVASDGISGGLIGSCVLVGVAWAVVDITNISHEWADILSGDLRSGTQGYAKILYKPAGTGLLWCCLQLGFHCCEDDDVDTDVVTCSMCADGTSAAVWELSFPSSLQLASSPIDWTADPDKIAFRDLLVAGQPFGLSQAGLFLINPDIDVACLWSQIFTFGPIGDRWTGTFSLDLTSPSVSVTLAITEDQSPSGSWQYDYTDMPASLDCETGNSFPMTLTGSPRLFDDFTVQLRPRNAEDVQPITLGSAAASFKATSKVMKLTGDPGGNTVTVIDGPMAVGGSEIVVIHQDSNLVTMQGTGAATSNTLQITGTSYLGQQGDALSIAHDGVKWIMTGLTGT